MNSGSRPRSPASNKAVMIPHVSDVTVNTGHSDVASDEGNALLETECTAAQCRELLKQRTDLTYQIVDRRICLKDVLVRSVNTEGRPTVLEIKLLAKKKSAIVQN